MGEDSFHCSLTNVQVLNLANPLPLYQSRPTCGDGFVDISCHELARGINRCSWWLENELGKARSFETVEYLGIPDLRYTMLMFACVKVSYKVCIQ